MVSEWYQKFYKMRDHLFEDSPEGADARAFYQGMVGVAAMVRLTIALKLPVTEGGQDWALEVARYDRIGEFLDYYETQPLDGDERSCLLELIIAALDDYLRIEGPDEQVTARVKRHVIESFEDQRYVVEYWARLDDPETAGWMITPLMREVWELCAT